ncbi:MAG: PQQ-dependent sugar dehydrogenase [Dehalococcoidia bacterium]
MRSGLGAAALLAVGAIVVAVVAGAVALALFGSGDATPSREPTAQPRDPSPVYAALPPGYRIASIASGLASPTALDGSADGRIFVAEQLTGDIRVITASGLHPEPFYTVEDLYIETSPGYVSELGLVGLIVEPGPELRILLYYSARSEQGARSTKLIRIREAGGRGASPETILEVDGAPVCCHIGGGLAWMADGTLLVGVADHEVAEDAQDVSSPAGKLLRITGEGAAPPDNPFAGRPDADPRVYAYGLRNPFSVAPDPAGDGGFVLDNGEIGFDSVYRLQAGANYGWPAHAVADPEVVAQPLKVYLESTGPAGALIYRGRLEAFDGSLLFCQFHRGGATHWFDPAENVPALQDRVLAGGCSSGIRALPDGYVYFLDYLDGALYRIDDGATVPMPE